MAGQVITPANVADKDGAAPLFIRHDPARLDHGRDRHGAADRIDADRQA
jgi:hypothetical protein